MFDKWYYACYALVAFILYLNYSLIKLRGENSSSFPQYKITVNIHERKRRYDNICCNPLLCTLDGTWTTRNDISDFEFHQVEDTNMELRIRKGWPTKLYHGDSRCGTKFPLPRSIHQNKSELYFLDVESQCDAFSNAPCCRDDVGWCGKGDWYCKCKQCFDYGNILHTELSEWKHFLNCPRPKMSHLETCDYLSRQFSSTVFIGDSLVRHVFSSLLIHLTNDTRTGALKNSLREVDKTYCGYENQFVDSSCHVKLAIEWDDIRTNEKYCKSSYLIPRISFVQAYNTQNKQLAFDTVRNALQEPRPLIFVGVGIHDNFNYDKVISEYLSPIVELRNVYKQSSEPVIIWLNTHASGPLKPMRYKLLQGDKKILKFNENLKEFCRKNSILIFDTFNITRGVHSFDGTHYGSTLNKLKVDLLIGALKSLQS